MKAKFKSGYLWVIYIIAIITLLYFFSACSTSRLPGSDLKFEKQTINNHNAKRLKLKFCNN